MFSSSLKRGICVLVISAFCIQNIDAMPLSINNNENNKKAVITTSHGLVVKQRKPNLYIRFFNRVYNKYAKKHAEDKQAENTKSENIIPLSHTK